MVTLDADGSTDPAEIPRFVAALCNGADFVKGSRFAQGGASSDITLCAQPGEPRAERARQRAVRHEVHRPLLRLQRLLARGCLPYMRVDCDGFEVETLINVRIAKAGLVVHEVPSYERDRITGRATCTPSAMDPRPAHDRARADLGSDSAP